MLTAKCINPTCERADVEVEIPPFVQIGAVAIRAEFVCLGCQCSLLRCEPRPITLVLTVTQARMIRGLVKPDILDDPGGYAPAADLIEMLDHALEHVE